MATQLTSTQRAQLSTMTQQLQAASKQLGTMQAAKAGATSTVSTGSQSSGSRAPDGGGTSTNGEQAYWNIGGQKIYSDSYEDALAYTQKHGGATSSSSSTDSGGADTSSSTSPSDKSLKPGDTGADVAALQQYLVQNGYLTPEQVGSGEGTYGPQTTAAVAKMQQDLGLQPTSGKGYYGPQTQAAIRQKYQTAHDNLKGGEAPSSASAGIGAVQGAVQSQESTDPVFGAMSGAISPIMAALQQVLNNINNPAVTGVSLQQEYTKMASDAGLPQMQTDMLNMQRIMAGSEDDIRDEVSKSGGTATESQVLAMAGARNKVILKNYNALATNYEAATNNIQSMMQYASSDQSVALQKQNMVASVSESMASFSTQMMSMGMTMQQHASDNLNKVVTNVGYQGLAMQAKDNPAQLSYYEKLLGLSDGSLSDPQSLAKLETMRQQQLALGQQKVNIQMYNAGLASGGGSTNTPGGYITQPNSGNQQLVALNANGTDSQGRPNSITSSQAQNLLKGGATLDAGTKNVVVPGVGYYVAQQDGSYRLSIDPASTEGQYIQIANRAQNPTPWQPQGSLANQRMTRNAMTRQVNSALTQYVNSPTYQQVANGAAYLSKVNAAIQSPGSVSDAELLDAIVKIDTGGGQITDVQLNTTLQGQTFGDKFSVVNDKVVGKGGVLSPQQRGDLQKLVHNTFSRFRNDYQKLYTMAMQNLDNQNIPDAFWGNMPDFSKLIDVAPAQY